MIYGVEVKPLNRIVDERGYLMEILRSDDENFRDFGQAYVSACQPGIIKAWHKHVFQTDQFCCVSGMLKIGLYDRRAGSPTEMETQTVVIGDLNPCLVIIPPGVWHGFKALGNTMAVVLNLPDKAYNRENPDEQRASVNEFNYNWNTAGW